MAKSEYYTIHIVANYKIGANWTACLNQMSNKRYPEINSNGWIALTLTPTKTLKQPIAKPGHQTCKMRLSCQHGMVKESK